MMIHRLIRSVAFVPLVVSASFLYAEALTGKVTDSETGEPLAGAQVFVKGTFVGTTTDVNGSYSLDLDGNVTVVVAYIGYKTQELATSGGSGNFAMEADVFSLQV